MNNTNHNIWWWQHHAVRMLLLQHSDNKTLQSVDGKMDGAKFGAIIENLLETAKDLRPLCK